MANTNAIKARFEDVRILDTATLNADARTYAVVGSAIGNPVRAICVTNNSSIDLFLSFDNTQYDGAAINPGKIYTAAYGFKLWDIATNRADNGGILNSPAGDMLYARLGTAGVAAVGKVVVEILYASEV